MKKLLLCAISLFSVFSVLSGAESNLRDFAPEEIFPGHLQGIAADESGIYWSCYDRILKTDWQGKKLACVPSVKHAGDCAIHDGKLYVATIFYNKKDQQAHPGITSAVLIYDCMTLKRLQLVPLRETARAGALTWYQDQLYVANDEYGYPKHTECGVCIYDKDMTFQKKVNFKTGVKMRYGIQTINVYKGKILAGFYSRPASFFLEPDTFRVLGTFPQNVSVGFAEVPESVFRRSGVICIGKLAGEKKKWHAQAAFYVEKDGKIVPFQLPGNAAENTAE